MTAKEKAKKLVNRYLDYIPFADNSIQRAKECALIAVQEILDVTKRPKYNQDNWNEITGFRYDKFWEQVKDEIKQL